MHATQRPAVYNKRTGMRLCGESILLCKSMLFSVGSHSVLRRSPHDCLCILAVLSAWANVCMLRPFFAVSSRSCRVGRWLLAFIMISSCRIPFLTLVMCAEVFSGLSLARGHGCCYTMVAAVCDS